MQYIVKTSQNGISRLDEDFRDFQVIIFSTARFQPGELKNHFPEGSVHPDLIIGDLRFPSKQKKLIFLLESKRKLFQKEIACGAKAKKIAPKSKKEIAGPEQKS